MYQDEQEASGCKASETVDFREEPKKQSKDEKQGKSFLMRVEVGLAVTAND